MSRIIYFLLSKQTLIEYHNKNKHGNIINPNSDKDAKNLN